MARISDIRLFVDFDGTITEYDIGDSIFEAFLPQSMLDAGWHDDIIARWKAGEISSFECLTKECNQSHVDEAGLKHFLDRFVFRAGFHEFYDWCRGNDVPLMILSDGMDFYIQYLLEKHGFGDIPFRSNGLVFRDDGTLGAEFPYMHTGCGLCGNCKRYHIDTMRRCGETVVYVGDGYSDRFAVRSSDVIFARGDLEEYCTTHEIEHHPFLDFHTILTYLEGNYE